MATGDHLKREDSTEASAAAEATARRSFLKASTTAGATGVTVLTLGRKAWATTSAGASGAQPGVSKTSTTG